MSRLSEATSAIRRVKCTTCGAQRGDSCTRRRSVEPVKGHHRARVARAEAALIRRAVNRIDSRNVRQTFANALPFIK